MVSLQKKKKKKKHVDFDKFLMQQQIAETCRNLIELDLLFVNWQAEGIEEMEAENHWQTFQKNFFSTHNLNDWLERR